VLWGRPLCSRNRQAARLTSVAVGKELVWSFRGSYLLRLCYFTRVRGWFCFLILTFIRETAHNDWGSFHDETNIVKTE
jgi:hypothetical protein